MEYDGDWALYEWAPEDGKVRITLINTASKCAYSCYFVLSNMSLSGAGDILHGFPCRHEWATAVMRRRYA